MDEATISLGGKQFTVKPLPWGKLKKVTAAINRIGMAAAAGIFDERALDDMALVLSMSFDIPLAELEEMPTDLVELNLAFDAVVKVSGLERQMEKALGEARRAGHLPASALIPTLTPGTPSTST